VGESGCGKTTTAHALFGLVPAPGRIVAGEIVLREKNLLALNEKRRNAIRGKEMGLILQDALSALNPVMRVGEQIAEVLRRHLARDKKSAKDETLAWMEKVRLPDPEKMYDHYPHQLSGGQRQRVLIAIALACRPALVVADEPTTALDVSLQSRILALLQELKSELHLSMLWITHDLAVVAQIADRVAVMQAGKIVETAATETLFTRPRHPYTQSLLAAIPRIAFSRPAATDKNSAP
jgi:peptide/nickel transport system ATP-binding protein